MTSIQFIWFLWPVSAMKLDRCLSNCTKLGGEFQVPDVVKSLLQFYLPWLKASASPTPCSSPCLLKSELFKDKKKTRHIINKKDQLSVTQKIFGKASGCDHTNSHNEVKGKSTVPHQCHPVTLRIVLSGLEATAFANNKNTAYLTSHKRH